MIDLKGSDVFVTKRIRGRVVPRATTGTRSRGRPAHPCARLLGIVSSTVDDVHIGRVLGRRRARSVDGLAQRGDLVRITLRRVAGHEPRSAVRRRRRWAATLCAANVQSGGRRRRRTSSFQEPRRGTLLTLRCAPPQTRRARWTCPSTDSDHYVVEARTSSRRSSRGHRWLLRKSSIPHAMPRTPRRSLLVPAA